MGPDIDHSVPNSKLYKWLLTISPPIMSEAERQEVE